jgi:hypothetical protein
MSLEFEGEKQNNSYLYDREPSGMASVLIKMGIVKDEDGARKVMIIVSIAIFALALFIFWMGQF